VQRRHYIGPDWQRRLQSSWWGQEVGRGVSGRSDWAFIDAVLFDVIIFFDVVFDTAASSHPGTCTDATSFFQLLHKSTDVDAGACSRWWAGHGVGQHRIEGVSL
jgi:hypothetical protein